MASSKHPKNTVDRQGGLGEDVPRPPDDLDRNPGIGTSKGVHSATGVDPEDLEAQSTVEGDVMNDTTAAGRRGPEPAGPDQQVAAPFRSTSGGGAPAGRACLRPSAGRRSGGTEETRMGYAIIAWDGDDAGAVDRRMAVRDRHVENLHRVGRGRAPRLRRAAVTRRTGSRRAR